MAPGMAHMCLPITTRCSFRPCHIRTVRLARRLQCRAVDERSSQRPGTPPPPPPPPPPPAFSSTEEQQQQQQGFFNTQDQKFSWPVVKEQVRPYLSPGAFVLGFLTVGLDTASKNFVLQDDPVNFLGTALMSAGIVTAATWVTFNFEQDPPPDRKF